MVFHTEQIHPAKSWQGIVRLCTLTMICCLVFAGCSHDPILVDPADPSGPGTNPTDTIPVDNTPFVPCDDDVVYFEYDVLPILISNCSVPTCHDDESREDGVILISYENVMNTADVRPFDLDGSDLYEVITEDDEDKWMPPSPRNRLTSEQVQVIRDWILQGAQNLTCDPDTLCNISNVSFARDVNPILVTNCRGCHSGPTPTGGISLENYTAIRSIAETGRLYGAIARLPGFTPMPRNRGPLQDCEIVLIKAWIDAGMPEN